MRKTRYFGKRSRSTEPGSGPASLSTSPIELGGNAAKDGSMCSIQISTVKSGPQRKMNFFSRCTKSWDLDGLTSPRCQNSRVEPFHKSRTDSTRTWKASIWKSQTTRDVPKCNINLHPNVHRIDFQTITTILLLNRNFRFKWATVPLTILWRSERANWTLWLKCQSSRWLLLRTRSTPIEPYVDTIVIYI